MGNTIEDWVSVLNIVAQFVVLLSIWLKMKKGRGPGRGVLKNRVGREEGNDNSVLTGSPYFQISILFSPFFTLFLLLLFHNSRGGHLPKILGGGGICKPYLLSPLMRPLGDGRGLAMKVVRLDLVWVGFISFPSSVSSPWRGVRRGN